MNHLSVEVLLNVFSFVPKEELITTIPQVCRRWKDVAADPSLFTTLDLVNDDPDTETSIKLLSAATWLTSLKLSRRKDTDVLIQHIGVDHPRLVKLVIDKCRGSRSKMDVSAMQLLYLVRRCTTLQQFSLLETLCNSKVLLTEIVVNLTDLRVIEVSKSLKYDSESLASITNNCTSIERIQLECVNEEPEFSSTAVVNFCYKYKESLTSFALFTHWTNASLASLSRCSNVQELTLSYSQDITDEGIMSLCQMTKLNTLTINGFGQISSTGWVRLYENPSMKGLVKLDHFTVNINDLVISAISLLPILTDLDIMGGLITDDGLLSLRNIPNLARLRIEWNQIITSQGWIRYFETSNVQQKITHLELLLCKNVNDEVKQVLSQNLRNLQQWELSR